MRKIAARIIRQRPVFFFCIMMLPFFAVYVLFVYKTPKVPFYEQENVVLTGTVNQKIISEEGLITALTIHGKQTFKCFLNSEQYTSTDLPIGSTVTVTGRVRFFRSAGNPGEFDVAAYYENRKILFYVNVQTVSVIVPPPNYLREYFFRIRNHFCNTVRKYCPIEYGTINTLLFGDKSELDDTRKNLYKTAGLSHFLVISGLHISIAGGGIYMALRHLGLERGLAAFLGIAFVLFYGCVVGFTVSVMRAVIMYFLHLLADILKRSYDLLTALAIAALITLCENPLWIRDSAFLYSYTAVLSVGLYVTFLQKKQEQKVFSMLYEKNSFKYLFAQFKLSATVPLIIYLALLPISLYFQSYSNILSVPLNIILGVLTAPVLFFAAGGFAFGLFKLSFLAGLCDFFCALLLRLIDFATKAVSQISFTKIIFKPSLSLVFCYYAVFLTVIFVFSSILPLIIKCFAMMGAALLISTNFNTAMYLTVLDVDQGDCIVIRTGTHSAVISDCGSTGRSNISENVIVPYLMSQGFTVIEDIYISHADTDHIGGIEYLIKNNIDDNIEIKRVIFPGFSEDKWDEKLIDLKELAMQKGIKTSTILSGGHVSYGSLQVTCLSPAKNNISGDSNRDSLVLHISFGEFDALLTGDATEETESALKLPSKVSFELLKVAHHGSRFSSSREFLERLSPKLAIISVGFTNSYGHPHPDTLQRLKSENISVYRTDQSGAITVTPTKTGIRIKEYYRYGK